MSGHTSYRTYWITWGVLLILTLSMLFVEATPFTRLLAVLFLLSAMFVKAFLIGGWFMHLRFERPALVIPLVFGTLLTVAFLFFLIAIDGAAMLRLAEP